MAVAWVQSSRSSTKTFLECRLFPVQACLLELKWLKGKVKEIGIRKFPMVLLLVHLVQRNGAKENCRICSFSVSFKEKP